MAELVNTFRSDLINLNRPKESCSESPRKWWKFAIQSILQQVRIKRNKFSWTAATMWHLDTIEEIYHEANLEMMRASSLGLRLITIEALREEVDFLKRDNYLLRVMLAESIHVEPEKVEIEVQCIASELDAEMLSRSPSKQSALADHISDLTAADFTEDDTVAVEKSQAAANEAPLVAADEITSIVTTDNNNNSNAASRQPNRASKPSSVSPRSKRGWIEPGPKPGAGIVKHKPRVYRLAETITDDHQLRPAKPQFSTVISPSPPSSSTRRLQPVEAKAFDSISTNVEHSKAAIEAAAIPSVSVTAAAAASLEVLQPIPPQQSRRSHRPSWREKHEQVLIDIYSTPVHQKSTRSSRSRSPRHARKEQRSPSPQSYRKKSPPKELIPRVDMTYSRQVAIDILNKVRTHNGKRPHGKEAGKDLSLAERTLLRSPFAHVVMRDPPIDNKPKTAAKVALPSPSPVHPIEEDAGVQQATVQQANTDSEFETPAAVTAITAAGVVDEESMLADTVVAVVTNVTQQQQQQRQQQQVVILDSSSPATLSPPLLSTAQEASVTIEQQPEGAKAKEEVEEEDDEDDQNLSQFCMQLLEQDMMIVDSYVLTAHSIHDEQAVSDEDGNIEIV